MGDGIGGISSLCAVLISRYNGRQLTRYCVVEQIVSHNYFLYYLTVKMAKANYPLGCEIERKLFLCAIWICYHNSRQLSRCWVMEQTVSHRYLLYCLTVIMVKANYLLGCGLGRKLFLCAILIDCHNGRWLTRCWVVEQPVSFHQVLYWYTLIMSDC